MRCKGAAVKLSDLKAVTELNSTLDLLTSARVSAEHGTLQLSSAIDGSTFDFGAILDSVTTRGTLLNMIAIRIEDVRGKMREMGVDPDA